MDVYIFNFVGAVLCMASLNMLYHHIKNTYMHNKYPDVKIHRTQGRIKNFKTGESETQNGPAKSY